MSDLFDIIKLHSLSHNAKASLIMQFKHLEHFATDSDQSISKYAINQQTKQRIRRINKKLKSLGIGGI